MSAPVEIDLLRALDVPTFAASVVGGHTHSGGGPSIVLGQVIKVADLPAGMTRQLPSVALVVELPDGSHVLGEITVGLFLAAASAVEALHPNAVAGQTMPDDPNEVDGRP